MAQQLPAELIDGTMPACRDRCCFSCGGVNLNLATDANVFATSGE